MSLKVLHIVFVALAELLAIGFAAWSFGRFNGGGGGHFLGYAIAALVVAIALLVYGRWFLRKMRGVSNL